MPKAYTKSEDWRRWALWLAPCVVLAVLITANILNWRDTRRLHDLVVRTELTNTAENVRAQIESLLSERVADLQVLEDTLLAHPPEMRLEKFRSIAQRVVRFEPAYFRISYIGENGLVLDSVASGREEDLTHLDLRTQPRRWNLLLQTRHTGQPAVSSPLRLASGGVGLVIYYPLSQPESGFLAGTFSLGEIIRRALQGVRRQELGVTIQIDGRHAYRTPDPRATRDESQNHADTFPLLGHQWTVGAFSRSGALHQRLYADAARRLYSNLGISICASLLLLLLASALTRLSRRERQLAISEAQFRALFQGASDGIVLMRENTIVSANQRFADILGYPLEKLIGHPPWDFSPPLQPDGAESIQAAQAIRQSIRAEKSRRFQWRHVRSDGAMVDVEVSLTQVPFADGQTVMQGIVRDVTRQMLAVRALQESEERFQTFLLSVNDIVWASSLETGKALFMNPAGERIYGRPAADFIHDPELWSKVVHPDYRHVLEEKQRALDLYGKADVEYPILRPDGEVRWLHDRTAVFESPRERRLGGIATDITDRKRAEEEARLRQSQLVQADRMISLGILVSGVAHEINNPNHFIMSNATQLQKIWQYAQPALDAYMRDNGDFMMAGRKYSARRERIPEMISSIVEGAERIRNIVNELRDYARDQSEARLEPVYPNDVLKSAMALLAGLLRKSTHHLSLNMADDLPRVRANYQRIEQVLINIIQNACQALPDPEKAIAVATRYDAAARSVIFEVRDQGIGIPQESLGHITDPFFTTKRDSDGMGLGLSISSSIMIEHGGALEFESQVGKGTTARAILPAETERGEA